MGMLKDMMMVATQGGYVSGHRASLLGEDFSKVVAFGPNPGGNDTFPSLRICFEAEDSWAWPHLGLDTGIEAQDGEKVGGLWVYEVEFHESEVDRESEEADEAWAHLTGGEWRRPTKEEVLRLSEGECPFDDGSMA